MKTSRTTARVILTGISSAALVWWCLLYLFALLCRFKLGHFPVPSLDDPKYIGFDALYMVVIFSGLFAFVSIVFWLLALPFTIRYRLLNKWNTTIFVTGFTLMLVQHIYDPFELISWILD